MKIAILSDIHANLSALDAVLSIISKYKIDSIIFLGDLINYGMRPNEVIARMKDIQIPFLAKLWGNHEKALVDNDLTKFSTDRGRTILEFTQKNLSIESWNYIDKEMNHDGCIELSINNKRFLLIHGGIDDPYWGKVDTTCIKDKHFSQFDYVLSGHTHICHYIEAFFSLENPSMRDKKKTIFINPGSIGQPRNHNPHAQFGILDTETTSYEHICVPYDIVHEQSFYTEEVDIFYKDRLTNGI